MKTADGGSTWIEVEPKGVFRYIKSIGNMVWLSYYSFQDTSYFSVSNDGGKIWSSKIVSDSQLMNGSFAIHPRNMKTIYMLCTDNNKNIYLLLKSSNGGSFRTVIEFKPHRYPNAICFDPINPKRLFLSTDYTGTQTAKNDAGILLTIDGGVSWKPVLKDACYHMDITASGAIYALSSKGIVVSKDNGASWYTIIDYKALSINSYYINRSTIKADEKNKLLYVRFTVTNTTGRDRDTNPYLYKFLRIKL
jgi:hypothetical protein